MAGACWNQNKVLHSDWFQGLLQEMWVPTVVSPRGWVDLMIPVCHSGISHVLNGTQLYTVKAHSHQYCLWRGKQSLYYSCVQFIKASLVSSQECLSTQECLPIISRIQEVECMTNNYLSAQNSFICGAEDYGLNQDS